jgi:hypothetical protein
VQVAAKALKLARQERRICLVDLLGRIAATRPNTTDSRMRGCNLIQRLAPIGVPELE